jgi:tetratricopeptide (TPR) repeat protein
MAAARGQWTTAAGRFREALAVNRSIGRIDGMASNHFMLGHAYGELGRRRRAKRAFKRARKIYKQIPNPPMVRQIDELLSAP